MIDPIQPSSIIEIANYPEDLKTTELLPHCVHQNCYYVCANELYYIDLQEGTPTWRKVSTLPFLQRNGQSMTSTPSGIVFFGGQDKNMVSYYNDLWIYSTQNWEYVTCDIPVRAFHAAACDQNGNLIICGGFIDSQHSLHDIYLINLKTQVVTELNIPFLPKVSYHSLTPLPDGAFILYGSKSEDTREEKSQNKGLKNEMYILNLQNACVKKIMTNYQKTEIDLHSASYVFGNLYLCSRNNPSSPVWLFNFERNIFIPYYIQIQSQPISPLCLFSIPFNRKDEKSKQNVICLQCITHDYKSYASIRIFTEEPPSDYYQLINRPDYIEFMRNRLIQSQSFFDSKGQLAFNSLTGNRLINSRRNNLIDINNKSQKLNSADIQETFALMDQLLSTNYLLLHAKKVSKLIEVTKQDFGIVNNNEFEREETREIKEFVSVHDIITDLMSLAPQREKELSELDRQCSNYVNEIENCTFQLLLTNFDPNASSSRSKRKRQESSNQECDSKKRSSKKDDGEKTSKKKQHRSKSYVSPLTKYERMIEDSQQLARQIVYERQRCNELTNERKKLTAMKKKKALFGIYDHLWNVSFKEMELKRKLESVQTEYFDALSQMVECREQELGITDQSTRDFSKKLASEMALEHKYKKLQTQLTEASTGLSNSISKLTNSNAQIEFDEKIQQLKQVENSIDSLNDVMGKLAQYFKPPMAKEQSHPTPSLLDSAALASKTRVQRGRAKVSSSIFKPNDKKEVKDDSESQTVFTPFDFSIGNEMSYVDDVERLITRIEDKLSDLNTAH